MNSTKVHNVYDLYFVISYPFSLKKKKKKKEEEEEEEEEEKKKDKKKVGTF